VVEAAGGVVRRRSPAGEEEVALIHRPRYDDWSLPKGKLEPGESGEEAALREVVEETGFRCRLAGPLPPVTYTDAKGRPKRVRYWLMEPLEGRFEPGHEADELRWCKTDEAVALLSYERDRELVRTAAGQPPAEP
jgi:8-oxo-dGTP pyrophosphatase MutT (NUDIX family)